MHGIRKAARNFEEKASLPHRVMPLTRVPLRPDISFANFTGHIMC
jgi:hypothetical protein